MNLSLEWANPNKSVKACRVYKLVFQLILLGSIVEYTLFAKHGQHALSIFIGMMALYCIKQLVRLTGLEDKLEQEERVG